MVVQADMEEPGREDENTEFVGLGCALELFSELDEVLGMIDQLKTIYTTRKAIECAYEKFRCVLTLYQEQPHLLDPHLDTILERIILIIRNKDEPIELKHEAFKYLHVIVKVRGYKVVVRHLPHEVSDLEPVLTMLERQNPKSTDTWETRYALLLWLSIIVKIPFHMTRLDSFQSTPGPSTADDGEKRKTVIQRLVDICKLYVLVGDSSRFPAAFLASHFFTRSDVKDEHLGPFIAFACEVVGSPKSDMSAQCGALAALAAILKHGSREDLIPHATELLQWLVNSNCRKKDIPLIRQLGMKVVQRIGLTFLKTRVAAWRYNRGCRSLTINLNAGDATRQIGAQQPTQSNPEEVGEDFDIPEEIEEVIEELIQGLQDSNTIVRWSAAKGIGRVTGRLPKELADEVVGSVLELFSEQNSDSAWHGGCLALAELGKRGLLLPQRLGEVVPVVLKALYYDEARGYVSVGAHIRDAACYVCWSFARAYDTEVLRPYVKDIAGALVVVTVFDREINCRRAASAAFQENVGRQGSFPHGIEILTTADYFAVGVRSNAYLNISTFIAQFEEYTLPLIDHLVKYKVDHWDVAIRELAGKALHNITPKSPEYIATCVLPQLLSRTTSIDLNARHGAVLAIAELLHALAVVGKERNQTIQEIIGEKFVQEVCSLVPKFKERGQFRGMGGELMKQACCVLVEKSSLAQMPFHDMSIIDEWQFLLDDCLSNEVATVRTRAVYALPAFLSEYYQHGDAEKCLRRQQGVISCYTGKLKAVNKATRMGFCLAIGSLPGFMLKGRVSSVIEALIGCTEITESTLKWAESRRDAVKALHTITNTIGIAHGNKQSDPGKVNKSLVDAMYSCFLRCLSEYTMDSRGDVGAWVREAAMTALQVLTTLVVKQDPTLLDACVIQKMMADVSQQAVERIDRTRSHAGRVFSSLIHSDPVVPHIPHHTEILQIFTQNLCQEELNWNSAADTFPLFIELLRLESYSASLMLGLVASVGGLTESLVKHSSSALFTHLKHLQQTPEEMRRLCGIILQVLIEWINSERLSDSLLTFLDRLLGSGCVHSVLVDPEVSFSSEILRVVKGVVTRSKDVHKLNRGVDVLCQLVQVPGEVSRRSLTQLLIFLCHRFPTIRTSTAGRLYEALMLYGDDAGLDPTGMEQAMTLISDTEWDQAIEIVRPIRNEICDHMGIPPPKVVQKKSNTSVIS